MTETGRPGSGNSAQAGAASSSRTSRQRIIAALRSRAVPGAPRRTRSPNRSSRKPWRAQPGADAGEQFQMALVVAGEAKREVAPPRLGIGGDPVPGGGERAGEAG